MNDDRLLIVIFLLACILGMVTLAAYYLSVIAEALQP